MVLFTRNSAEDRGTIFWWNCGCYSKRKYVSHIYRFSTPCFGSNGPLPLPLQRRAMLIWPIFWNTQTSMQVFCCKLLSRAEAPGCYFSLSKKTAFNANAFNCFDRPMYRPPRPMLQRIMWMSISLGLCIFKKISMHNSNICRFFVVPSAGHIAAGAAERSFGGSECTGAAMWGIAERVRHQGVWTSNHPPTFSQSLIKLCQFL